MMETESMLNEWADVPVSYMTRDLLLYSVGIGATNLNYIYEFADEFAAFPTYPVVLGFKGVDQDAVSFPSPAMLSAAKMPGLPGTKVGLDGERYIEKVKSIDPDGADNLVLRTRNVGVHKKGSGASCDTEALLVDKDTGEVYYKMLSASFLVGARDFQDSGVSNSQKIAVPSRSPDTVVEVPTSPRQAELYRLSGDYNPLHVDPEFAKMNGFDAPILHGLCSLGMSCNAVMDTYCPEDPELFKAINVRFASPVLPGQTLIVEMWKESSRIIFLTKIKETGKTCISNAYVDLEPQAKL